MLKHQFHQRIIDATLQVPFIYHGQWNLTEGGSWWLMNFPSMDWGRYFIGGIEILISLALFINHLRKVALLLAATIMIGAVYLHLDSGYSFKTNGFETPLAYLLLSLGLLLKPQEENKHAS